MNNLTTKQIYLVGALSLVLGIVFDYLFYDQLIGISFVIYISLLLVGLFGCLFVFKINYHRDALWFLPVIIFFSLMLGIRASEFLIFFNVVLTLGLLFLLAKSLMGQRISHYLFFDYLMTAVFLPLRMLAKSFSALGRMISLGKGIKDQPKTAQIIKGILITLPLAVFFLFLFSAADLAFNRIISDILSFNFHLNEDITAQIFLALILGVLWLGAYSYILENTSQTKDTSSSTLAIGYRFGNIEAGILFSTLNVLFLAFVAIQIRYLFAGHEAITRLGYTYSEYVHRGFGELVIVSLFTFALIFLAERYIERQENKASLWFKVLTGTLVILVLVIMASAFMRLGVYEEAYGFTRLRILVQAFIIWLAAIFLWLGYKIVRNTKDHLFVWGMFLSVLVFFAFFNLFNLDAFIANKNINQFLSSGELDMKYLATLSTDAVPTLMPLLEMSELKDKDGRPLPGVVASALKRHYDIDSRQSFSEYNLSRNKAKKLISGQWDTISSLAAQDALLPENLDTTISLD